MEDNSLQLLALFCMNEELNIHVWS